MKEKNRLSRGETTLNVPPSANQRGRRMSRHDALALTPSTESSSIFSHSDNTTYYFTFMYERISLFSNSNLFFSFSIGLLMLFHLYLYLKLKHMDVLVDHLSHLIKL